MSEEARLRSEFAAWCIGFRAHTQQSQRDLAQALGIHKSTVTRWETGELYPKWAKRLQLNEWARETGYRAVPPNPFGGKRQ
jgi:transcriptional regulator with XRE-family HTH domain